MKVKLISTVSALLIMALALTVAFAMPKNQKLLGQKSSVSTASVKKTTGYIVKEYQGKIGIFTPGNQNPGQVLNVYVTSLPQSEQKRLEAGIRVSTHVGLLEMIENYTS